MPLYVIMLFVSSGIAATLAALVCVRRSAQGPPALAFLLLGVGLSSFAYAMNLSAPTLGQKLFWNRIEYLGAACIPTLMLVVSLALTCPGKPPVSRRVLVALFLVPVFTLLANWSNAWHGLYYARTWLEPSGSLLLLAKERGPFYFVAFAYNYMVIGLALYFIIRAMRQAGGRPPPQLVLLLAAFLLPVVLNLPYLLRLMPHPHVNLTPLGFFGSTLLLFLALFRYRLISTMPLDLEARDQMLLNHAHALFYTISPEGIMTYVSPNWPQVLGHAPEEVMGRSFSVFVRPEDHAACFAFLARVVATGALQTGAEYRVVHKNGEIFWHTSSIMPVKDREGRLLAYVGVAHDITRQKQAQQELAEANAQLSQLIASRESELRGAIREALTAAESEDRRIGQDIHDGLCQDLIGLVRLAEGAEARTAVAQIREHASRLAVVARNFSHDLTLHELEVQTLSEALETLASRTDRLFQAETELNLPDPLPPLTREQTLHIYRIVREAVGNAVKHAQARHLWIELVLEPHQLVVSVSNDGHPLPEPAQLVAGFGLKQMRMRARLLGGALAIRRNKQNLTVVELVIPLEGAPA